MSLRSVGIACILLFAPPAMADTCSTLDFKGRLDGGLRLSRPVTGAIVAGFGTQTHPLLLIPKFHYGLDLAGVYDEPVFAAGKGRVDFAEPKGEYGNLVRIDHGNGLVTAYGHLSRIAVKVGDCVDPGVAVGHLGATGLTAGPQVHFEVLIDGKHVDPTLFVGGTRP